MVKNRFNLISEFKPAGDQNRAIRDLVKGIKDGKELQTLLGVTGSGKTFTMANVIAEINRPALIMVHNKTLAAQLYNELKTLFPENCVEYFVSYYDYYQPEAYVPGRDLYIEKATLLNDEIERLRLNATKSLFEREDVIIVASVSALYGLGSSETYHKMVLFLEKDKEFPIDKLSKKLIDINYENSPLSFERGTFRVMGDSVEIFPAYEEKNGIRVEYFGDTIEGIYLIDSLKKDQLEILDKVAIYPATHFTTSDDMMASAISTIQEELKDRLNYFKDKNKLLEFQRIKERTLYDIEMIEQTGRCNGIENYSRHFTGRKEGEPPPTLIDYFPKDYLLFIDESHVTIPQIGGIYFADRSRKLNLVNYGFRLPSALDNRPLKFTEFEERMGSTIFVSATPAEYETLNSDKIVQQIIRPTGLIDPKIEIQPIKGQVDHLYGEIDEVIKKGNKVLVTTLTKKMAEHLTEYYSELGLRVKYLHSDIDTIERVKIVESLKNDVIDLIIGINLLREGLDMPEVSLVAILDADKEGFLRSQRSLIQTIGRASRNIDGKVILYADKITNSMKIAIDETERRRKLQREYNKKHNITPTTVKSSKRKTFDIVEDKIDDKIKLKSPEQFETLIKELTKKMERAATALQFEDAAKIRDQIRNLKKQLLEL